MSTKRFLTLLVLPFALGTAGLCAFTLLGGRDLLCALLKLAVMP